MSQAIRELKEKQVAEIKEMITKAQSFVLVDYKGLTVAQDTELRNEYRANGVKYVVLKNRLLKIALNELGYTQFDEALNGPTAVAFAMTDNISAPAKIASAKAATTKKLGFKCGMVDGTYLDVEGCKDLAKLPSKETLIAQLLGLLNEPIAGFARVLDAYANKQSEANA